MPPAPHTHSDVRVLFARWVLPIVGPPLKDGAVIFENYSIKDVLFRDELGYKYPPEYMEQLSLNSHEYGDAIIVPGLINLHTHLDYSALRAFDVESSMFQWIRGLVGKAAVWSPEQWRASALYGAQEAALSGTSCLVDSSFTGLSVEAIAHLGLRAVVGLELFGLRDDESNLVWGQWLAKFDALRNTEASASRIAIATEKIILTVAPHAPYTVCPTLWLKATTWAQEKSLPLLAHLSESVEECQWIAGENRTIDEYLAFVRKLKDPAESPKDSDIPNDIAQIKWKGRGLTPVRHLKNFGLLDDHLVAAHAVHLDEQDIELLAQANAKIAHCPRSNARLRNGRAPLSQILGSNIRFGLGTDSLASCDDLDLLQEARFAANILRLADPDLSWTSANILSSLTIEAARIIGLDRIVGSIEPGKAADIAVFSINPLEYGQDNPYDLLLHGKSKLIDLFVDGSQVVSAGQLVNN